MSRILNKAWALSEAWLVKFGYRPDVHTVALALAVSEHESQSGDAWDFDEISMHNWGATQLPMHYQLTHEERASLPSPIPIHALARRSLHIALGVIPKTFNGAIDLPTYDYARRFLYVDSQDGSDAKAYWVFESAFGTDREGARYFLGLLVKGNVTPAFMAAASTDELAATMKPSYGYGRPVEEYQAALRRLFPGIERGLTTFDAQNPSHDDSYQDSPEPIPASWGGEAPPKATSPAPVPSSPSPGSPCSPGGTSGGAEGDPAAFITDYTDDGPIYNEELEDKKE